MANPIQEDRGFMDADHFIADAQAIPTDGDADNSEHCQDMALTAPQIEAGIPVKLKIKVTTAFAISAGTPTLTIGIITDGSAPTGATWVSAATVASGVLILPYNAAAGAIYEAILPPKPGVAYERYVGISMTPSTSGFSAGAIDAWLDFD